MIKTVYHGRRGGLPDDKPPPLFFADKKDDAVWYAYERGPHSEKPVITETTIKIEKGASFEDLKQAVLDTGANRKDILNHSAYEGENDIDYLYVPKIMETLKNKGFDNFQGLDVLTNMEISVTVIFDLAQIIGKRYEVVGEDAENSR